MFIRLKEGGGIERFVILRLPTQDNGIFKKIKQLSKQHPELQVLEMDALPVLTIRAAGGLRTTGSDLNAQRICLALLAGGKRGKGIDLSEALRGCLA